MKCNLYCISRADSEIEAMVRDFGMKIQGFGAKLSVIDIFTPAIAKAQKISAQKARESYTNALSPFIKPHAQNIALHPQAKMLDSFQFAQTFENKQEVNFFIGGAFGFEEAFLQKLKTLSLSPLTLSHKIAKLVLCEQIYRALSILAKHPYHK